MSSKRIDAANLTDHEILGLQDETDRLNQRVTQNEAAIASLNARVTALEEADPVEPEPPVDPPVEPDPSKVSYLSAFETGAIQSPNSNPDGWGEQAYSDPSEQLKVMGSDGSMVTYEGDYMFRALYNQGMKEADTKGRNRSELSSPGRITFDIGKEYWVGFTVAMKDNPNNELIINQSNRQNCHMFQVHEASGDGTSGMNMRSGQWQFSFGTYPEVPSGAIALGRWSTMVMHFKVSNGSDGFCKLWIDSSTGLDIPNYSRTGANSWSGGCYLKLGVYRAGIGDDGYDYAEQYYDSVRVAIDNNAKYADVYPGSYS